MEMVIAAEKWDLLVTVADGAVALFNATSPAIFAPNFQRCIIHLYDLILKFVLADFGHEVSKFVKTETHNTS